MVLNVCERNIYNNTLFKYGEQIVLNVSNISKLHLIKKSVPTDSIRLYMHIEIPRANTNMTMQTIH